MEPLKYRAGQRLENRVRNCSVIIKQDSGKLESGQRRSDVDGETLFEGPAFVRTPRRKTEEDVAPMLRAEAVLAVATRTNLKRAERVEVTGHVMAGTYFVSSAKPSWSGRDWTLELETR